MRITLVGRDGALVRAWRSVFAEVEDVTVVEGDYFDHPADAMVSPANSFGIMDGGIDLAIRDQLGLGVQTRLQRSIVEHHHGELPIGSAEVVETGDARWPYLVAAPTMRIPESVASTLNAYLAFRAVLLACTRHPITSLVCCGLATGIGRMEPTRCATQMRIALSHARPGADPVVPADPRGPRGAAEELSPPTPAPARTRRRAPTTWASARPGADPSVDEPTAARSSG